MGGRRKTAPVTFSCTPERKRLVQAMADKLTGGSLTALFDKLVNKAMADYGPELLGVAEEEESVAKVASG